jgi:hypothetical protein
MKREEEINKAAMECSPCFEYRRELFIKGAKWADKHPANPWHSVKEGELPPFNKPCLFNCNGTTYIGFVRGDESLYLENNLDLPLSINDINYWMEIPELPTQQTE